MADAQGVLVVGEVADGNLTGLTTELLGAGRRLVEKAGGKVGCLLVGAAVSGVANDAIAYGADVVYVAEDGAFEPYAAEAWLPAAQEAAAKASPAAVLLGQTSIGRDLAPRLAFRLGVGVSMDTVAIEYDSKLHFTRAAYGGNARAQLAPKSLPAVATVKGKSQDPLEPDSGRGGTVEHIAARPAADQARVKVLGQEKAKVEGVRLEDADVVVTGGRGLGGPEGFQALEELAAVLGGAVGASRAACDLGWYPPSAQVGLTGVTVSPTLYVAVAVSGASQHMAGMSGSKNIVAINKDPEANMVKAARFAVVADFKQVLPSLIEELRKLRA